MGDTIKPLTNAAKGEAEKLGHQVAMTTDLASVQLALCHIVAPYITE